MKRKLNNKEYELIEKKMKIDDLLFNIFNTRIYNFVKKEKGNFEEINPNDTEKIKEAQLGVYKRLKENMSDDKNKPIINSIRKDGIQEKPIVLSNGLLISGNNRLSIIKFLIEKEEWKFGDHIDVLELKGDHLTKEEIIIFELEIQNIQSKQLDYDHMENIMRAHELLNNLEKYNISEKEALALTKLKNKRNVYDIVDSLKAISKNYNTEDILQYIDKYKIFSWIESFTALRKKKNISGSLIAIEDLRSIYSKVMFFSKIKLIDYRYAITNIAKIEEQALFQKELSNFKEVVDTQFSIYEEELRESILKKDDFNIDNLIASIPNEKIKKCDEIIKQELIRLNNIDSSSSKSNNEIFSEKALKIIKLFKEIEDLDFIISEENRQIINSLKKSGELIAEKYEEKNK